MLLQIPFFKCGSKLIVLYLSYNNLFFSSLKTSFLNCLLLVGLDLLVFFWFLDSWHYWFLLSPKLRCFISFLWGTWLKLLPSKKIKCITSASFSKQMCKIRTHFTVCSILWISWLFSITPASVHSLLWLLRPSFQNKWVKAHLKGLQCLHCHTGDQTWHTTPSLWLGSRLQLFTVCYSEKMNK